MLPVLQANSSSVWSVSTSCASISVTSSSRSSMFMSTVPFLVTICFRLKVFSLSLGGSKAVLRSAKGSAICRGLCSWDLRRPPFVGEACTSPLFSRSRPRLPLVERVWVISSCTLPPRPPVLPRPPVPTLPAETPSRGVLSSPPGSSSKEEKAKFAVTGRRVELEPPSPASLLSNRIFMRAFSILRIVALSKAWKATSSGLSSLTCGCCVSWRKRQRERITCATTSAPLFGSLVRLPTKACTCFRRESGHGAAAAASKPSLP
mmetsp:Transcript_50739/g.147247  ORF Transcript_50739/g.147247 Transcript_50739/m.147247 type:complete len:262 (+) Transcript_50739:657-1442(+)